MVKGKWALKASESADVQTSPFFWPTQIPSRHGGDDGKWWRWERGERGQAHACLVFEKAANSVSCVVS